MVRPVSASLAKRDLTMIFKIWIQPICTCQIPGFQLSSLFTWHTLSWFLEVSLNLTFLGVLHWLHYKCSNNSSPLFSITDIVYSLGGTNHSAKCCISFLMHYLLLLLPGEICTSLSNVWSMKEGRYISHSLSHQPWLEMHRSFHIHTLIDIINHICRAKES